MSLWCLRRSKRKCFQGLFNDAINRESRRGKRIEFQTYGADMLRITRKCFPNPWSGSEITSVVPESLERFPNHSESYLALVLHLSVVDCEILIIWVWNFLISSKMGFSSLPVKPGSTPIDGEMWFCNMICPGDEPASICRRLHLRAPRLYCWYGQLGCRGGHRKKGACRHRWEQGMSNQLLLLLLLLHSQLKSQSAVIVG